MVYLSNFTSFLFIKDKGRHSIVTLVNMDIEDKKGKRVTIDLDEVITRSDGTKATMREFVKEMLYYNPSFEITTSPKGESWYLKRKVSNVPNKS